MVSLHWKEFVEPAATIGIHTKSRNNAICMAESAAASRAKMPMSTATPAAMKVQPVKYAQNGALATNWG